MYLDVAVCGARESLYVSAQQTEGNLANINNGLVIPSTPDTGNLPVMSYLAVYRTTDTAGCHSHKGKWVHALSSVQPHKP